MGRMKDLFIKMMEEQLYRNPSEHLSAEELTEETFEVQKGNVTTTIKYWFNKQGFPVGYAYESTAKVDNQEEDVNHLNKLLKEAVEAQSFEEAAELKKKIDALKKKTNK